MREFDEIAYEWDEYRTEPSSALKFFLPLVQPADVVLDAGCGNGRNLLEVAKRCALAYGVDSSRKMLELAKEGKVKSLDNVVLLNASIIHMPLQPKSVDKILCLAVLHHLRSGRERLAALKEFHRVLKGNGIVFASAWNKKQKKFEGATSDDALVKWQKRDGGVVERYYHFFGEKELVELAEAAGLAVKEVFYEKKGVKNVAEGAHNLCVIAEK